MSVTNLAYTARRLESIAPHVPPPQLQILVTALSEFGWLQIALARQHEIQNAADVMGRAIPADELAVSVFCPVAACAPCKARSAAFFRSHYTTLQDCG